jgi:hypothetical protein
VDRLTDNNPVGGGEGTGMAGDLRYCIANAGDGDDIAFGGGITGTINLRGALPILTHRISIHGPGAGLMTVRRDTGGNYSIFIVPSATVSISGLTISNGISSGGGGIANSGTLTISACIISGNRATSDIGGGIFSSGTLTVSNSILSDNFALEGGGALASFGDATVTVSDSMLSGNSTDLNQFGEGGAINNDGRMMTVINSTVSGNSALNGGGISNGAHGGMLMLRNSTVSGNYGVGLAGGIYNHGGTLMVSSSTVSGNSTNGRGGGIYNNQANVTVSSSTLSGNLAGEGGGIYNYGGSLTVSNSTIAGNPRGGGINNAAPGGMLTVNNSTIAGNSTNARGGGIAAGTMVARNTIIAGNTNPAGPDDLYGSLGSLGHNLIGNIQGGSGFVPTDLINVDPLLSTLQDNGGPTQTIALLPGSPAIDAGDNTDAPEWDQRGPGYPRIVNGIIDIGAFEVQIGAATRLTISAPTMVTSGTPFDVTVTALDAYGRTASGYTGTVTFITTDRDPGVVLPADYTFRLDDGGVHRFTDTGQGETTLVTPGVQALVVIDLDGRFNATAFVTVGGDGGGASAAAPARFQDTGTGAKQPSPSVSGCPIRFDEPAGWSSEFCRQQLFTPESDHVPPLAQNGRTGNRAASLMDRFFAALGEESGLADGPITD